MKNILKIKALGALLIMGSLSTSCTDDDLTFSQGVKPIVSAAVSSSDIAEGDTFTVTLTTNTAYREAMDFKLVLDSGSSENDDFTVAGPSELTLGDGLGSLPAWKVVFPANATSHTFDVTFAKDLNVEGPEVANFKLTSSGNGNGLISGSGIMSINIEDFEFCTWVLEATDTYGDGWNNAEIRLTDGGEVRDYHNDGSTGTDVQTILIPVEKNAAYSFEFVSGDWDGEILYTLTSPDGTVFSDGPSPTVGVFTSGTSTCN